METKVTDNSVQAFHSLVEESPDWILGLTEKYLLYILRTHPDVSESRYNRKTGSYPDNRRAAFHDAYFFHEIVDSLTQIIQVAVKDGVESYAKTYATGNVAENLNLLDKWISFHLDFTEKDERKRILQARENLSELRGQVLIFRANQPELMN